MKKYIDLDKAVAALKDYFCDPDIGWDETGPVIVGVCEVLLGKLPSEDVRENITGKWIQDNRFDAVNVYRCSERGQLELSPTYNFCPKCWANMREW